MLQQQLWHLAYPFPIALSVSIVKKAGFRQYWPVSHFMWSMLTYLEIAKERLGSLSAIFMAQLIGINLIAGPNQRTCFVVRQNTPAP